MNTNKIAKSGFSLMELLIVMVILAGLATMIIPNMSSGTEAAKLTSMRNDARNTISTLQAKYIDTQDYSNVFSAGDYVDSDDDGVAQTKLSDGSNLQVSANNTITLGVEDCDGGTGNGFSIAVANSQVNGKTVAYNSCNDGKIQVTSGSSN